MPVGTRASAKPGTVAARKSPSPPGNASPKARPQSPSSAKARTKSRSPEPGKPPEKAAASSQASPPAPAEDEQGKAKAGAPAVAKGPPGPRGFHAADIRQALLQRAELAQEDAVFESDGSSLTSDDEGGDPEDKESKLASSQTIALASFRKGGGASVSLDPSKNVLDSSPVVFAEAKAAAAQHAKRMAGARHQSIDGGIRGHPSRRLLRLRSEAGALIAWSEASPAAAAGGEGGLPGAQDARKVALQAAELDSMVRRAAAPAGDFPVDYPGAVWLPPAERINAMMVQQLLKLSAVTPQIEAPLQSEGSDNEGPQEPPRSGFTYELSGTAASASSGWVGSAQAEEIAGLEARLQRIRAVLGHDGVAGGDSVASTTARLHRRLRALHSMESDTSCQQLRASLHVLSSELDFLMEEEKVMHQRDKEANTQEVRELIQELTPEEQITQLHARLAPLDSVARRVEDVGKLLGDQARQYAEICTFAEDLSCAEARVSHAADILRTTAEVAQTMKASAESGLAQLQRNIEAIESKLEARHRAATM